ncbi:zinc finger, CCHC-type, Gag-polypeptide of LTR copia-type [Artemisia annua]|uniref:Zinc finger, CCHC-type, Gag-polypeptide of LTR copia-type n=1 Tax=Artemisia annua TaxID=35608 RepID=A0A2U1KX83_ARTAN|nr:zinc finger, CCHC-type, Gag-polypeptide of LTR copia-type [Artemisia annua]
MAETLGHTTAKDVWCALADAYSHESVERMHILRDSLRQLQKVNIDESQVSISPPNVLASPTTQPVVSPSSAPRCDLCPNITEPTSNAQSSTEPTVAPFISDPSTVDATSDVPHAVPCVLATKPYIAILEV